MSTVVTLRQSYSASPRIELGNAIESSMLSGQSLATGKRILHAWQDPTGLAIGSNMQATANTLDVVLTGVIQSQQLLEVAQTSMEQLLNRCNDLTTMLARAKSGLVTNDTIINTLSTAFSLTKQEMIRIAQDTEFNGVKLLNGTGGTRAKGTAATAATNANYAYDSAKISLNGVKFKASTDGKTSDAKAMSDFEYGTVIVSGGTLAPDATNPTTKLILTGITLTFPNAKILADDDKISCRANVIVSKLDLTLTGKIKDGKFTVDSGGIEKGTSTGLDTSTTIIDDSGGITGFDTTDPFDLDFTTTNITNAEKAFVDGINTYYALSGGKVATSTFDFVTGSDLINSQIQVVLPNMRLDSHTYEGDNSAIQGLIGTLSTDKNTLTETPDNLLDLNSKSDADNNVPLVDALRNVIITQLDNIGAQQQRFRNVVDQLSVYTEAMDSAQGVFLNADLAKTTEALGKNMASINVIIAALQNMFSISNSIAKLATG